MNLTHSDHSQTASIIDPKQLALSVKSWSDLLKRKYFFQVVMLSRPIVAKKRLGFRTRHA